MADPTAVRVSIPMSVAQDLGAFKRTLGSILERLGCPACCSGHDIHFELQRRFSFEGDLDVPQTSFGQKHALHEMTAHRVSAGLSPKLAGDLDGVFAAIDRIADLSGHPQCTSGDDLFLRTEINILVDRAGRLDERALVIG